MFNYIIFILLYIDGWAYATQKFYFEKAGIKSNVPFSWNEATVNDIKKRNPSLYDTEFMLLANKERPYPIIGTGLGIYIYVFIFKYNF
jgi:hypothetical protein